MTNLVKLCCAALIALPLVGCSSGGGTNAPEDDAFQQGLAKMAAQNKTPAPKKTGGVQAPTQPGGGTPPPTKATGTTG